MKPISGGHVDKTSAQRGFQSSSIFGSLKSLDRHALLRRCPTIFLATLCLLLGLWVGWWSSLYVTGWVQGGAVLNSQLGPSHLVSYFAESEGFSECNILATELYAHPSTDDKGFFEYNTFCHGRNRLLQAMSEGGRVGFDAPYRSRGCNHRWFDVEKMCFILERFDALVLVGDDILHAIYGAMNILLRRDLAMGALDSSAMDHTLRENCRCANQFIKQDCRQHFVKGSDQSIKQDDAGRPYFCNRIKHQFIQINSASPSLRSIEQFKQLVPKAPTSHYRPIAVICSFSPYTMSSSDAATSLLKFVQLADDSERNTPILWIGPAAAGHIEVKGRKGNQEIWDFDRKMTHIARENDVQVLGMWNLTVQATSWDGMRFGEKVAITQAMMVFNWLSRLESS